MACLVSYSDSNTDDTSDEEDENPNKTCTNNGIKRRLSKEHDSKSELATKKHAKVESPVK